MIPLSHKNGRKLEVMSIYNLRPLLDPIIHKDIIEIAETKFDEEDELWLQIHAIECNLESNMKLSWKVG